MAPRRERVRRVLGRRGDSPRSRTLRRAAAGRRRLGGVIFDFNALGLPSDIAGALAEAFWGHYGPRQIGTAIACWSRVKVFARFVLETRVVRSLPDVNGDLLGYYVEWLNRQRGPDGKLWSKSTRSAIFGTLRKLLQWLARCRPGVLSLIEYPSNPFPWKNRDAPRRPKMTPSELRALLRACERDIERLRGERQRADEEVSAADPGALDPLVSRGALLACIDERFGGLLPKTRVLMSAGNSRCYAGLVKHGGRKAIESCLYPNIDTILPYYLAILIHTAGNAEAIAALACDCLQPVPLLEDRDLLVWSKPRAATLQRRSFRRGASFEPPALVREVIDWTKRLRPHSRPPDRDKLFLIKSASGVRALSAMSTFQTLRDFEARHGLTRVVPASIRPSVLTALYRSSGDLKKVKVVANHARLSTTVGYVQGPEVDSQNWNRIASLQRVFLGHIGEAARLTGNKDGTSTAPTSVSSALRAIPAGTAVSLFGFDCRDPFAGIAPGTRAGELCGNFLACLSCPNAVIPRDAHTLARLLQARDHLQAAAAELHPARWEAIYAPALRILEEDILTRFSEDELARAERLVTELAALPPLR